MRKKIQRKCPSCLSCVCLFDAWNISILKSLFACLSIANRNSPIALVCVFFMLLARVQILLMYAVTYPVHKLCSRTPLCDNVELHHQCFTNKRILNILGRLLPTKTASYLLGPVNHSQVDCRLRR